MRRMAFGRGCECAFGETFDDRERSTVAPARCNLSALREPRRYILVGKSVESLWVVKDSRARLGAVFRSAEAAQRFARREARALGCHVVVDGGS